MRKPRRPACRDINVTQALSYPFLRRNAINIMLLPSLFFMAVLMCGQGSDDLPPLFDQAVPWVALLLTFSILGYGWKLIGVLREHAYDAPAPDWTLESVGVSIWDGFKFILLILLTLLVSTAPLTGFETCNWLKFQPKSLPTEPSSETSYSEYGAPTSEERLKLQRTVKESTKALAGDPKNLQGYMTRCAAYDDLQDYQHALADSNTAISLAPIRAEVFRLRGNVHQNAGQNRKAVEDFRRAIELNPRDAESFERRGTAYKALKESELAISDFSKAIVLHSRPWVYGQRADTYMEIGQTSKAWVDYAKAIEVAPKSEKAWHYSDRAQAYAKLNLHTKALDDYTKAIKLSPNLTWYYDLRAACHSALNQRQDAINDYSKVIRINPNSAHSYLSRANAYSELGDWPKALVDYNKAVAVEPSNFWPYFVRGVAYLDREEWQSAIDDFDRVISLSPDATRAYLQRADAELKLEQTDKAVDDYTHVISSDPTSAKALKGRGDAFRKLGRESEAISDHQKARRLDAQILTAENERAIEAYMTKSRIPLAVVSAVLCLFMMPFSLGAIVQSAHSRSLFSLFNVPLVWKAGTRCYRKALLVSFVVAIVNPVCLVTLNVVCESHYILAAPVLVALAFISFHLIAQAFDAYRDHNTACREVESEVTSEPVMASTSVY